jgi:membrane fusion protein, multidrug efflux system
MAKPGESNDPQYVELLDEIQRLRDEQQRLRDEQERLRRERAEFTTDGSPSKSHDREGPENDGRGSEEAKVDEAPWPERGKHEGPDGGFERQDSGPPARERLRRFYAEHKTAVTFGVLGFVALGIALFFLLRYFSSYESTDNAQVDGYINPISSRISGHVVQVYVDQNQFVTAGQLLVELDSSDYQNVLDQANASYASALAALRGENPNVPIIRTTTQTTISTGQAEVTTAQAALLGSQQQYQARLAEQAQAEANNAKAQRDVIRYRGLAERAEISREQFDAIVASAKSQAAQVEAAHAAANAAQKSIDQARAALLQAETRLSEANVNAPRSVAVSRAGVQVRQAAVLSAKAQVEQAALNLSYTKIYAPVSGVVADRSVEKGQSIAPGQQLVMISQIYSLWITANFKETQIRRMQAGQAVEIAVDAFKSKYKGYVESMPGATGAITSLLPPENATGNYVKVVQRLPVRIRFYQDQDPEHRLRPGMSVVPKVWLK